MPPSFMSGVQQQPLSQPHPQPLGAVFVPLQPQPPSRPPLPQKPHSRIKRISQPPTPLLQLHPMIEYLPEDFEHSAHSML